MAALFDQPASERKLYDYTFDAGITNSALEDPFAPFVRDQLRSIFGRRGAIELPTSDLLLPLAAIYEGSKHRPKRVVDTEGTVLQLPYDLIVPFCRKVARAPIARLKRWCVDPVYRDGVTGGAPQAF